MYKQSGTWNSLTLVAEIGPQFPGGPPSIVTEYNVKFQKGSAEPQLLTTRSPTL